jgi:hypothetical protein
MTGPASPYVVPGQLTKGYPLGISWQSIPTNSASDAEKYAAQVNICQQATAMADAKANQLLRASQNTEQLFGPGSWRVNALPNGNTRLLLSQWPIMSVSAIQVALSNVFPLQWTSVATGAWLVERPSLYITGSSAAADSGTGGQAVQMGPGYLLWGGGGSFGSYVIETTYIAGWPHAGITVVASAGDLVLNVDDCTGWAPTTPGAAGIAGQGCSGVIYDQAGNQEPITCLAASTTAGPGVLTLATALQYAHSPGITVSALPGQIQWATALYAASLALTRGATATKIQDIAGTGGATASGAMDLQKQADELIKPFARVI